MNPLLIIGIGFDDWLAFHMHFEWWGKDENKRDCDGIHQPSTDSPHCQLVVHYLAAMPQQALHSPLQGWQPTVSEQAQHPQDGCSPVQHNKGE